MLKFVVCVCRFEGGFVLFVSHSTTFVLHKHRGTSGHRGVVPVVNDGYVSSSAHKQPNAFRVTFVSSFRDRVQGTEVKARRVGVKVTGEW